MEFPRSPANRLGIDYRSPPPRKIAVPIIDAHAHIRGLEASRLYFEAAAKYGIARTVSMSPLSELDMLGAAFPGRLEFIAIPEWSKQAATAEFQQGWMADLETFRAKGARICKFWMAPLMRQKYGITLDDAFMGPIVDRAYSLGYHFMAHIADPSVWWTEKYKDASVWGSKRDQYVQLEWFLRRASDRIVIGAHMGGTVEDLAFLQYLLDTYPNYFVDSSATKWIVREVARQPDAVRAFIIRNADRILFGSDIVAGPTYDFDHYASRYWAHQMMWETPHRGESPIEDPDAPNPPLLAGLDLPPDVLAKLYRGNFERLLPPQ